MKVAIMMRALDQDSGFRAYIENLLDELLRLDTRNRYLLLYRTPRWLGRFASFPNVEERLVTAPHKLLWDQVVVPWHAWRARADLIFNPKFSVPLVSHCPVTMGLQEPAWWAWPEHYELFDRWYMRLSLPIYIRRSAHLFPWSRFNVEETQRLLGVRLPPYTLAYGAPPKRFAPVADPTAHAEIRQRYELPEHYLLSVTRVDHPGVEGATTFHAGKNPETTLRAFLACRHRIPHHLVFAGRKVREYMEHLGFEGDDFTRVHFLGFVPHEELPALYSAADLFTIPSLYEGFGFTLLEAMACGCPCIASRTGACPETAGDAALLADPADPEDFADKIVRVLDDRTLARELSERSVRRARGFSWSGTAQAMLNSFLCVVGAAGEAVGPFIGTLPPL
jgi:glycosyltransferase involved in cell wall biosynthesis